jgi:hypothetical protein
MGEYKIYGTEEGTLSGSTSSIRGKRKLVDIFKLSDNEKFPEVD